VLPAIALMMEAASTSEESANFYQTIRRNNPQDGHLHTSRRENVKSHTKNFNPSSLEDTALLAETDY
jgi:hypothetical protein